jgi:hypothetical protein
MEVFEVRLMDPGYLNRIARFTVMRFSWHKTKPNRPLLSLIQHYVIIGVTVFLIGTAIPYPMLAQVQLETTIPNLGPQQLVAGESRPAESPLLTIYNPRNRTIPVSEVQTIYLSACKVVEQEFSRTGPVRPRLRLFVGSDADRVYYPKYEIQLTKWDKFKFAQGVVILATDSLLPNAKKYSLSKLALVEAEGVVDVRELKDGRTSLAAGPRN